MKCKTAGIEIGKSLLKAPVYGYKIDQFWQSWMLPGL